MNCANARCEFEAGHESEHPCGIHPSIVPEIKAGLADVAVQARGGMWFTCEQVKRLLRELNSGANYTADNEIHPTTITFRNGTTVKLVGDHLVIERGRYD